MSYSGMLIVGSDPSDVREVFKTCHNLAVFPCIRARHRCLDGSQYADMRFAIPL